MEAASEARDTTASATSRGWPMRWSAAMHSNVVLTPLDREAFGHMRDRGLAEAVDSFAGQRHGAGLRAHIDDGAAPTAEHVLAGVLGEKEGRLDVEVELEVEHLLGIGLDRPLVDATAVD